MSWSRTAVISKRARNASLLWWATKCCTAWLMKWLRWPGLTMRSMVFTVVSGNTMLIRLLMGEELNYLTST